MFSKTTEYALRATIFIAQKGKEEKKLSIAEIAKAIDSPASFTAKILQQLTADNKIISSTRGPRGGFYISSKAQKLPLKAVLEALGDDGIFEDCVLGLTLCSETNPCPLHDDYKKIRQQIIRLFERKTISELAGELQSGDTVLRSTIFKK